MTENVISIDLWNTLIRISPANSGFLVSFLSSKSTLDEHAIAEITKKIGREFDYKAIKLGRELKSDKKLKSLILKSKAKINLDDLVDAVLNNLTNNLPLLTEPKNIHKLSEVLNNKGIGFVTSSNSGFVSARIMRKVIEMVGITTLPSYAGSYFSEEIGYAKPSEYFFREIKKKYNILLHVGDHPIADYKVKNVKSLIYDPARSHPELSPNRIISLTDILDWV